MSATLEAPVVLKDIFLPIPATVLDVQTMTEKEKFFKFKIESDDITPYKPGQFMEISVPGIGEAPISISSSPSRVEPGEFEMVVREVGNVTSALHALTPGEVVGVRGPFGTSFPVDTEEMKGKDILFICGGIGLVPVRSAIHYVMDHRADYGKVSILFGTRRPEDRLFINELFDWKQMPDVEFMETVDVATPAWGGNVGVITTLMRFTDVDPENTVGVICGPPIMYKFVLMELAKLKLPKEQILVSLERHMKCGVGKCGHCQINGLYACQAGPVLRYSDVANVKEAI